MGEKTKAKERKCKLCGRVLFAITADGLKRHTETCKPNS